MTDPLRSFRQRSFRQTAAPFVGVEHRQGDAWVALDRPPRNGINPTLAHSLQRVMRTLLDDDHVKAIVLTGSSNCFAAGADLAFFLRQLKSGDLARIEQFSAQLHQLCDTIACSAKPVLAAIRGPALGAGLELSLPCVRIIASRTATLGLPETGLGICPGSGGTQRVPRRIGRGLAKWLIYTGHLLSAADALQLGLIDACVPDRELESAVGAEIDQLVGGRPSPRAAVAPATAYRILDETFTRCSLSELLECSHRETMSSDWDVRTRRAVAKLKTRSATALMLAERLIDGGRDLPMAAALQLEVDAQREMFLNRDTLPRLQAAVPTAAEIKDPGRDR